VSGFSDEGGDLRQCLRERNAAEKLNCELLGALKLAEDALSRSPFSTQMWPNGTHPNAGIVMIRAAIAKAEDRL
jgi:hypothetical protein